MENINEKILELFKTMINDIMEVYPEEKGSIYEKYESIMILETLDIDDCELIQNFLAKINEKSSLITNKNEEVIQDDFIDGISLKKIWESGISDTSKSNIWKYLQTFCIININLNSSKELQQLLSGETKEIDRENKKDIKDLKKIKKLKESINDINEENKEKNQLEQSQMGNIFENTGIGQLAKEIAEGLDFEEMMGKEDNNNSDLEGDTEQSMESVMQNIMNPGNFMNLFTNINEKVQEKISTGALNEEMLTGEAQNLYGNFQNNPMFQTMMNNPELKKFQEQMASTEQQNEKEKTNNPEEKENAIKEAKKNKEVRVEKLDHKEPVVAKNKTQERLQKKLAQREEKKIKLNTEQKKTEKTDNVIVEKTQ
tara:strand:+ start:2956 stop:4065 length:1110 start_codon:yes stop_codon:yes gene_type:complete